MSTPFSVTILGFDQAYASTITGAADLFALAGVSWQRFNKLAPQAFFKVQIASLNGDTIKCINNIGLSSHVAIQDVKSTDILLIPTIGGRIEKTLADNHGLLKYIQQLAHSGVDIASNCSGAFFLAEAGLLEHKSATTHWGYAELFKQRYPDVDLQPEKLITQADNIYCSGGGMAWFDLTLLLIERYCGYDTAKQAAKAHVLDMTRGMQSAYASLISRKFHNDEKIKQIQDWLEAHYTEQVQLEHLPERFNLTSRTFKRRFKQATAFTPIGYLQQLRVEAAKKLLEASDSRLDTVVNQVGYEDNSSFTRLFKKHTGLSPNQYRIKFKR